MAGCLACVMSILLRIAAAIKRMQNPLPKRQRTIRILATRVRCQRIVVLLIRVKETKQDHYFLYVQSNALSRPFDPQMDLICD